MDMISGTTSNTATSALHHKKEAARDDGDGVRKPRPHQNEALECPRCHSTNTKFCYYNNNTMTQPRYLCKACRRYWTQGGSLRNVPVGGSSRKNKKNLALGSSCSSSSSASSSSSSSRSKINITQLMMMPMPTATLTDYPNVLPTFVSNGRGFELPIPTGMDMDHQVSLPLAPPLSSEAQGRWWSPVVVIITACEPQ